MKQWFKKGEEIRLFDVIDDKVITNIIVDDRVIYNPTLQQFYSDGWEDYTPTPYVPSYEEKVVNLIRERYSQNDELKYSRWLSEVTILKTKVLTEDETAELQEFSEYVAWCHEEAKK